MGSPGQRGRAATAGILERRDIQAILEPLGIREPAATRAPRGQAALLECRATRALQDILAPRATQDILELAAILELRATLEPVAIVEPRGHRATAATRELPGSAARCHFQP